MSRKPEAERIAALKTFSEKPNPRDAKPQAVPKCEECGGGYDDVLMIGEAKSHGITVPRTHTTYVPHKNGCMNGLRPQPAQAVGDEAGATCEHGRIKHHYGWDDTDENSVSFCPGPKVAHPTPEPSRWEMSAADGDALMAEIERMDSKARYALGGVRIVEAAVRLGIVVPAIQKLDPISSDVVEAVAKAICNSHDWSPSPDDGDVYATWNDEPSIQETFREEARAAIAAYRAATRQG